MAQKRVFPRAAGVADAAVGKTYFSGKIYTGHQGERQGKDPGNLLLIR
jgi:hypothetical protein